MACALTRALGSALERNSEQIIYTLVCDFLAKQNEICSLRNILNDSKIDGITSIPSLATFRRIESGGANGGAVSPRRDHNSSECPKQVSVDDRFSRRCFADTAIFGN